MFASALRASTGVELYWPVIILRLLFWPFVAYPVQRLRGMAAMLVQRSSVR